MKTQINGPEAHEAISALMDGQLQGAALTDTLGRMAADDARECWHVYHVVADVLRSGDLAACGRDGAFLSRLGQQIRQDSVVRAGATAQPIVLSAPSRRDAANDGVFRWKMVAGLASVAAVAAIGWNMSSVLSPAGGGAQLAAATDAAPTSVRTVAATAAPAAAVPSQTVVAAAPVQALAAVPAADGGAVMLRDPRLDELLAAHRAASGTSALGNASGFLRNATFEGPGR